MPNYICIAILYVCFFYISDLICKSDLKLHFRKNFMAKMIVTLKISVVTNFSDIRNCVRFSRLANIVHFVENFIKGLVTKAKVPLCFKKSALKLYFREKFYRK